MLKKSGQYLLLEWKFNEKRDTTFCISNGRESGKYQDL